MNRGPYIPYRPFERTDGVLARIDENGDELRLHRNEVGLWHVARWNVDRWSHDGWRGTVAYGFTRRDLVAIGAVVLPE